MTGLGLSDSAAWSEAKQLLSVALPTVLIQVLVVIPPALTAAYIGRSFGAVYLDAFTLANLTGNLFSLSLLSGMFSAADTLSPQAYGAGNYNELGKLAIRGFAIAMVILVLMNLLVIPNIDRILLLFGEDPQPSKYTKEWYGIYVWSLPFNALFTVIWKFLSSQEIMLPLVLSSLFACTLVLPLCLQLLMPTMGFKGSALSLVIYSIAQVVFLLMYLRWKRPHHPESWSGLAKWFEAMEWNQIKNYIRLGLGGVLSSSEWWYWEVVCLAIGTLGVVPLGIHAIPTQVITVLFMLPIGVGIALSIRLGITVPSSVLQAKRLVVGTAIASTAVFGIISCLVYTERHRIFAFFTDEKELLDGLDEIWVKVAWFNFFLSIFGIFMGVSAGLGMQLTFGVVTAICMWLGGLPTIYYFAIICGGGIGSAWFWLTPPYVAIDVVMLWKFAAADWDEISREIRIREDMESKSDKEKDCPTSEVTGLLA